MDPAAHWQTIYRSKADEELSWLQSSPRTSLELIDRIDPQPRRVIDVGGGQSTFAGEALARGAEDVVVLDIAEAAIERGKERLGALAERVRWIVGDALDIPALGLGEFDLWHDRAVFHFLTDPDERRRYVDAAARSVRPGGHAIMATFAPSGPEKCSGLPVRRCDAESLREEFDPFFELIHSEEETHTTPWGKGQAFTYALLRRRG